jgi:hypothetical protein
MQESGSIDAANRVYRYDTHLQIPLQKNGLPLESLPKAALFIKA